MAVNDEVTVALEELTAELIAVLDRVWARVTAAEAALLADWPALGGLQRRVRLRELGALVGQLMGQADALAVRFTNTTVPAAYELGATAAAFTLGGKRLTADLDALGALLTTTRGDLLAATAFVRQSTKELIRVLATDFLTLKLVGGATAVQTGRDLAEAMDANRITAVVYKNGARHGLDDYSAMLLRTRSAEAYQLGGFGQAEAHGVTYMEVMDGFTCGWTAHDDPEKANGKIVTLDEARAYPVSHPNCVMPGSRVAWYGAPLEAARARYYGPSFTIKAGDYSATVGPNHPVLTRRGWVPAHLLHEGDELVHDRRLGCHVVAGVARGLDLEQVPPVEDVFVTLGEPARGELGRDDLHGDAVFCEGEVEVVSAVGPLGLVGQAGIVEQGREFAFVGSSEALGAVSGERQVVGVAVGVRDSTLVEGAHAVPDLLGGQRGPGEPVGGRDVANDSALTCDPQDDRVGTADLLGDLLRAEAAGVEGCDLVAVVGTGLGSASPGAVFRFPASGVERGAAGGAGPVDVHQAHDMEFIVLTSIVRGFHDGYVYDFSTEGGAFTVDGLMVKNCVRVSTPRVDIRTAHDAARATPSLRAAQDADQALVAARRAQDVAARSVAAQRFARTHAGLLTDSPFRVGSVAAMRHARRVARRAG